MRRRSENGPQIKPYPHVLHDTYRTDETENKQLVVEGRNERFGGSDKTGIHCRLTHALFPTHLVEAHTCLPAHSGEGTKRFPSGASSIHDLRETLGGKGRHSHHIRLCPHVLPAPTHQREGGNGHQIKPCSHMFTHSFQHISTKRTPSGAFKTSLEAMTKRGMELTVPAQNLEALS